MSEKSPGGANFAGLLERNLKLPAAAPKVGATKVETLTQVAVECPELCPRYTARVIRGVKVGPSPAWLQKRLATIGQPSVNNVVDITNYVLMETGQPLHAFDLAKLHGRKIIVREARSGEKFAAINHKSYALESGMCVIADAIGMTPRERGAELERRLRAVEKKVREAGDADQPDPQAQARAEQFIARAEQFEKQAAKAEAAGRAKEADEARASAAQWRDWAQTATRAVAKKR